jgi:hypothetical protein
VDHLIFPRIVRVFVASDPRLRGYRGLANGWAIRAPGTYSLVSEAARCPQWPLSFTALATRRNRCPGYPGHSPPATSPTAAHRHPRRWFRRHAAECLWQMTLPISKTSYLGRPMAQVWLRLAEGASPPLHALAPSNAASVGNVGPSEKSEGARLGDGVGYNRDRRTASTPAMAAAAAKNIAKSSASDAHAKPRLNKKTNAIMVSSRTLASNPCPPLCRRPKL